MARISKKTKDELLFAISYIQQLIDMEEHVIQNCFQVSKAQALKNSLIVLAHDIENLKQGAKK